MRLTDNMQAICSIVMVRLSALGDVLMCVPLLRTLQATYPHAHITWVIARPAHELVEHIANVEWVIIDKPQTIQDYYRFYCQFKHRTFDVLLALQASFRANLLYPFIKAKRKIGYDTLRAKDLHRWMVRETIPPGHDHTLESFLKFGAMIGTRKSVVCWDLPLQAEDACLIETYHLQDKSFMVINPAASKSERIWRVEHYGKIANMAQARWGVEVVLSGGPATLDRSLAERILNIAPHCIDLVGKTKPRQLLAIMKKAKVVLCPDTGPAHMGASVDTPVVSIHAVTNPQLSGPYPFLPFVVNYYPEALRIFLHQSETTVRWGKQVRYAQAMDLVPLEAVLAKLDAVLLQG